MKITVKTSEIEMSMEHPVETVDVVYYVSRTTNLINIATELITICSEKTIEILKVKNEQSR